MGTRQPLELSAGEACFLKHWMFDELHFTDKSLPRHAKRMQVERQVKPAELAEVIAAWMPKSEDQWHAVESMPAGTPEWPWESEREFRDRLAEARAILLARREQTESNGVQANARSDGATVRT